MTHHHRAELHRIRSGSNAKAPHDPDQGKVAGDEATARWLFSTTMAPRGAEVTDEY